MTNELMPPHGLPIVAVMGLTGSGKSHFIAQLTGDLSITGDDLESFTQKVAWYKVEVGGKNMILLDTPGTDDSDPSDSMILQEIAGFLANAYNEKILLSGIIYMHDITQVRMPSSSITSLEIFKEICGENFYKNICFVSNRWDMVPDKVGCKKVEQLENDKYWGELLKGGGRHIAFDGCKSGATSILSKVLNNEAATPALAVQMVDGKQRLVETPAGKIAEGDLLKRIEELEKRLEKQQALLVELLKSGSHGNLPEVQKLVRDLQAGLDKYRKDLDNIRTFQPEHYAAITGAIGATIGAFMIGGPVAAGAVAVASSVAFTWRFATGRF